MQKSEALPVFCLMQNTFLGYLCCNVMLFLCESRGDWTA